MTVANFFMDRHAGCRPLAMTEKKDCRGEEIRFSMTEGREKICLALADI